MPVKSTVKREKNRIVEDTEAAPVLRLESIFSCTARLFIADSEDPSSSCTSKLTLLLLMLLLLAPL